MKRISIVAITLCAFLFSNAQSIEPSTFNTVRFEKILLKKINTYRVENNVKPLVSNLSVKKAAMDQSDFLKTKKELTHSQPSKEKGTVQARLLRYVSPTNFAVAENIARTSILKQTQVYKRDGNTEFVEIKTYDEAATYILNSWINSKLHRENLLNNKYVLSGLATYYNTRENTFTVVQVLARLH